MGRNAAYKNKLSYRPRSEFLITESNRIKVPNGCFRGLNVIIGTLNCLEHLLNKLKIKTKKNNPIFTKFPGFHPFYLSYSMLISVLSSFSANFGKLNA